MCVCIYIYMWIKSYIYMFIYADILSEIPSGISYIFWHSIALWHSLRRLAPWSRLFTGAPGDLEVLGRSPWHVELPEYLPACRCLPDLAEWRIRLTFSWADPKGKASFPAKNWPWKVWYVGPGGSCKPCSAISGLTALNKPILSNS